MFLLIHVLLDSLHLRNWNPPPPFQKKKGGVDIEDLNTVDVSQKLILDER